MGTPADRDQAPLADGAGVTATQVTTCQWHPHHTSEDYRCKLPVEALIVPVCSLHNPDPNKDLDRFNQTLGRKIKEEEADDGIPVINLAGVEFPTGADFRGRAFKKAVTFGGAHFGGLAHFADAHFGGAARFTGTHFGGEVDFLRTHFDGVASFNGTQFSGEADLRQAQFGSRANFPGAQFDGEAHFANAHFERQAYFGDAQFGGQALFGRVHFGGRADFRQARFGGEARFGNAHFDREARFGNAHFDRGAYFRDAQFGGQALFGRAHFGGRADFRQAQFGWEARFIRTGFPPKDSDAMVYLGGLAPGSALNVRLEGVDLSRVSFLRSDVSQIQFVGCTWAKMPDHPLLPFLPFPPGFLTQRRTVIYDEVALDDPGPGDVVAENRRLVAELYRQLRLNYEANRQEAEAGHFYIGQMEMRRQDGASYSRMYRLLLAAYRVLAMYGESYLRPPFFYFFFGAVFALAYLWGGFQVGQAQVRYNPGTFDWGQAGHFFKDSVRAYVQALTAGGLLGANLFGGQMGTGLETTSWWVPAVRYVNMLLDTFLVGFFVIALRRHFHR